MRRLDAYRKNMAAWRNATSEYRRNRSACAIAFAVAAMVLALIIFSELCWGAERTPRRMRVVATGYCGGPCAICQTTGITKTGRDARKRGVAVDPDAIALGARIDIPGVGAWIRADDIGGAIKGNKIDIRFVDHKTAKAWGRRTITVRVWE